jgi:hypothetical protein
VEGMTDWYEIMSEDGDGEHGCCLLCDDAEPGCLCYECKCTKCLHYELDELEGGYCTMVDELRNKATRADHQYKIFQKHVVTAKAVLASILVYPEMKILSNRYWIPKSIIIDGEYVPKWFSEKTF